MQGSESERPTCSCGHDRYHHFARPRLEYSLWGGALLMMQFVSARPTRIEFSCGRCGELFEVTTDERIREAFRRYPDIYEKP